MNEVRLITLDPGHFHAALIQKEMYPEVSKRSTVYAPLGPDVVDHLQRVARFNHRAERPTSWEIDVHTSADFLQRMIADRPGNVVVLSGRNRRKIDLIQAAVKAGLHVLADKPWIIQAADLPRLEAVLDEAEKNQLVAYDIMTERYEITSILQRELVNDADIFGSPLPGTAEEPGVYMDSVHHIMKMVAGVPNQRPPWFFDVNEQGEALADVGTHLVDMAQWTLYPEQRLDAAKDIRILGSKHWPTRISPAQFRQVTGHTSTEDLDYYCNTQISYTLRGILVKMDVLWNYEAPAGAGDTYTAWFRGSRARIEIRQEAANDYRPQVYLVPNPGAGDAVEKAAGKLVQKWQERWPGVALAAAPGGAMYLIIPERYRVGHEAHFAQVTRQFFENLRAPSSIPAWERSGMLAKYTVSTTPAA